MKVETVSLATRASSGSGGISRGSSGPYPASVWPQPVGVGALTGGRLWPACMDAPGAGPGASARGRALGPQPAALGCHALVAGRRARDGEHQGRDDHPDAAITLRPRAAMAGGRSARRGAGRRAATGAAARAARGSGRGMAQAVAEAAAAGLGRRLGDTLEALAEAAAMARARRVRNLLEAFAEAAAVELLRRLRERLEA